MLGKKEIKDIQSLGRKKERDATKLFIAEGPKVVAELAALLPGELQMVYATEEWAAEHGPAIDAQKLQVIAPFELEKISQLQTPNSVLAVFRQLPIVKRTGSFSIYLDTIQDPGNFGTIIRIADWFGICSVVCAPGCADLYNPKVVQSTMASLARVHVLYDEDGHWLKGQEGPIYAATLHGRSLYSVEKSSRGILLIGNESRGLRAELAAMATHEVTIPRRGAAESLNAAVATGIILSHLLP